MTEPIEIVPIDVRLRLVVYIKPEALAEVLNRPASIFGGKAPMSYAAEHGWDAVVDKYEHLFSYETTD